ncbi:hypothetical protein D3C78_1625580 [compost metagenome]
MAKMVEHYGSVTLVDNSQLTALTTHRRLETHLTRAHEQQRAVAGQEIDARLELLAIPFSILRIDSKTIATFRQNRNEA